MKKNNITIFIILILLIAATGCSLPKKNDTENKISKTPHKEEANEQATTQNQFTRWQENFDKASSTAIIIGNRILTIGSEDSGGNITANRIIIGDNETNFNELGMNARVRTNENENNTAANNENNTHPNFTRGQMPDFKNMNEEERTKMREEMRAMGISRNTQTTMGQVPTRLFYQTKLYF